VAALARGGSWQGKVEPGWACCSDVGWWLDLVERKMRVSWFMTRFESRGAHGCGE
jgi:hypothetical protein